MALLKSKSGKKSGDKNGRNLEQDRKHILNKNSSFYSKEAYKSLRTNIIFSIPSEGCRRICITSANASEGKSITTLNTAISFAETGQRVLLIDADMRRPNQSKLLAMKASPGLSNILANLSTAEEAVRKEVFPNLDVIFSGEIPPNPSELLGHERMAQLLNEVSEQYDYIVIDTPPVNVVTDVSILSRLVDGVLFVVRCGESESGAVISAVRSLEFAGAKLLGFVLNGVGSGGQYKYGKYKYGKYKYGRYGKYGYEQYAYTSDEPEQEADTNSANSSGG